MDWQTVADKHSLEEEEEEEEIHRESVLISM